VVEVVVVVAVDRNGGGSSGDAGGGNAGDGSIFWRGVVSVQTSLNNKQYQK
jgi:hypothetical protein